MVLNDHGFFISDKILIQMESYVSEKENSPQFAK